MIMLCAVADYTHLARETANVQTASSEGARYAAANPTASDDAVAAYVREACALGDTASVTVTSADAPSKPVTLKSGDKSVTARYAREKVTVKVVEDVSCIFPLKSLGVKGATDDGWQVHSETSSIRSEIEGRDMAAFPTTRKHVHLPARARSSSSWSCRCCSRSSSPSGRSRCSPTRTP